jgi:hypothetical protein
VASENARLGEVVLDRLHGFERFQARIHVVFDIDANGILHVKARDKDTGEEREVQIRDSLDPQEAPVGALDEEESLAPSEESARPTITGPFRATELMDVLYFLHANGKTGRVELDGPAGTGSLWLRDGELSHAQFDEERGVGAMQLLLTLAEGHYAFHEGETADGPVEIEAPFGKVVS